MNLFGLTQKFSSIIIRPPRQTYRTSELGPPNFQLKGFSYERKDFSLRNSRGFSLQCSYYYQNGVTEHNQNKPLVIFLHSNSSSRVGIKAYLKQLMPNFDVLAFDFCGSGNSEGTFTTLGYQQKEDLRTVLTYMIQKHKIKRAILWGRSMGAVTAILYMAKYGKIKNNPQQKIKNESANIVKGLILDSPFSNLPSLIYQFAQINFPLIPNFIIANFLEDMQKHIENTVWGKESADFNLFKLNPAKAIKNIDSRIPIFFFAGKNDSLVKISHIKQLFKEALHIQKKELQIIEGGHNDFRPQHLKKTIVDFLCSSLKILNKTDLVKKMEVKKPNFKDKVVKSKNQGDIQKKIVKQRDNEKESKQQYNCLNNSVRKIVVNQSSKRFTKNNAYYIPLNAAKRASQENLQYNDQRVSPFLKKKFQQRINESKLNNTDWVRSQKISLRSSINDSNYSIKNRDLNPEHQQRTKISQFKHSCKTDFDSKSIDFASDEYYLNISQFAQFQPFQISKKQIPENQSIKRHRSNTQINLNSPFSVNYNLPRTSTKSIQQHQNQIKRLELMRKSSLRQWNTAQEAPLNIKATKFLNIQSPLNLSFTSERKFIQKKQSQFKPQFPVNYSYSFQEVKPYVFNHQKQYFNQQHAKSSNLYYQKTNFSDNHIPSFLKNKHSSFQQDSHLNNNSLQYKQINIQPNSMWLTPQQRK